MAYKSTCSFLTNQGIVRHGSKTDVYSKALCKKIREKLGLTKKQLSDVAIHKVTNLANSEIANWTINNLEGTFIHPSKNMGMLCVSKFLPVEFRDDNDEKIAKIETLDISELKKKQMLKHYNVKMGDKLDMIALHNLGEKIPLMNLSTLFYTYKLIWFNKRNCKMKKAEIYRLKADRKVTQAIYENVIKNNKMYFELQMHDFIKRNIRNGY